MSNEKFNCTADMKEKMYQYLYDLIKIKSVTGSEKQLGDYLFDKLTSFGLDVKRQLVEKDRYNIIAEIKGANKGPRILLAGHMDTVSPMDGWKTDPFTPIKTDDKIYGRGSCDMKAGIAVILTVAEEIQKKRIHLNGDILIAFVCDEEAYSKGVKTLIKNKIEADFGIFAEPEFDPVIIGCPGKALIKGEFYGVAAHASKPENGINAIEEACKVICNLNKLPLEKDEKLGAQPYVTLNFNGGYKEYSIIIPDKCEFKLNKHLVKGENKDKLVNDLNELCKKELIKAKTKFTIEEPYYPPYTVDENNIYINKLNKCYEKVILKKMKKGYGTGVCDANCLTIDAGIPTICFGPSGKNLHAANEWVSMEEMEQVLNAYLLFFNDLNKN